MPVTSKTRSRSLENIQVNELKGGEGGMEQLNKAEKRGVLNKAKMQTNAGKVRNFHYPQSRIAPKKI